MRNRTDEAGKSREEGEQEEPQGIGGRRRKIGMGTGDKHCEDWATDSKAGVHGGKETVVLVVEEEGLGRGSR